MAGKPIECKAAVLWAPKTDLVIENVIVAVPQAKEVRVKILYSGICFSDVHAQEGNFEQAEYPVIPGHESVGVVESVGEGVTTLKPGDNVIPIWCIECGDCSTCTRKIKRNACIRVITHGFVGQYFDGSKRITCRGKEVGSFCFCGTFSEYTIVPEIGLAKIPSGIKLDKLAPFGCCVPTGYGASKFTANIRAGSTVAVWGLGAVGLCAVLGARDAKAGRIIGIDLNSNKFPLAQKFGCTRCLNPKDCPTRSTKDQLDDVTSMSGIDYALVCVGSQAAAADAIAAASHNGGEVIIVGLVEGDISINANDLIFGKTLKGSWGGDCNFREEIPKLVAAYMDGKFPTDDLITHTLPFEKINEGLDLLKKGLSIRTVLKY